MNRRKVYGPHVAHVNRLIRGNVIGGRTWSLCIIRLDRRQP